VNEAPHDYIVIGSGATGGPLAANLARAGFRVLLLEAGGEDPGRFMMSQPSTRTLLKIRRCAGTFTFTIAAARLSNPAMRISPQSAVASGILALPLWADALLITR